MPEPWRIQQQKRADASLSRLLEAHPGLSLDKDEPGWRVGTNLVTFGAFEGQPVVLKYYDWKPRRENEETALRLFAPTGLVPKLYPVESDSVLVMERLRSSTPNCVEPGKQQSDGQDDRQNRHRRVRVRPGRVASGVASL